MIERFLPDEAATRELGEDIAAALQPGDVVALTGDLGAGKTALARAIIRALADDPDLDVPSPTFSLVQEYEARISIRHFDLYRLGDAQELEEIGLGDDDGSGVTLVEWPERASSRFDGAIRVTLTECDDGRQAAIAAAPDALARIEHSFAIRAFLNEAGHTQARRAYLLGDASIRAYETVTDADGARMILMDAPARHDEPPVQGGVPYSRIARLAQSVEAFVAVAGLLRERDFCTPQVFAGDLDAGLLLIEHLGSASFLEDGMPVAERYCAAAELLARIHQTQWPHEVDVSAFAGGRLYRVPPYDHAALAIETELLLDWYFPFARREAASEKVRAAFRDIWKRLFMCLDGAEQSLVLRDFHSPNIIWRGGREGMDRLGLIDVQDAVFGPAAYDVASLAFDARVTVSAELEARICEAYCAARERVPGDFDRAAFEQAFAITAAQRNSKLLGTFVRLDRRDGKSGYLKHLPRIRDYLRRALAHPALEELRAFYAREGVLDEDTRE